MFEEQIKAGVAWLDETVPDWRSKIDTSTLRLCSTRDCVLGQVFGSDEIGSLDGYVVVMEDPRGMTDSAKYGFTVDYDPVEAYLKSIGESEWAYFPAWETLQDEWLSELSDGKKAA